MGEVQNAFNIEKEGSYIIAVKNPTISNPPNAGLSSEQKVEYPSEYAQKFGDKRWIPVNPVDLLDFNGVEIIFIGGAEDIVKELGESGEQLLKEEEEDLKKIDDQSLFHELRMSSKSHRAEPLLQGIWK